MKTKKKFKFDENLERTLKARRRLVRRFKNFDAFCEFLFELERRPCPPLAAGQRFFTRGPNRSIKAKLSIVVAMQEKRWPEKALFLTEDRRHIVSLLCFR